MANSDKDSFLDNYSMGVRYEFELGKNKLKAFFIISGYREN